MGDILKFYLLFLVFLLPNVHADFELSSCEFQKLAKRELAFTEDPLAYVERFRREVDPFNETDRLKQKSPTFGEFFGQADIEKVFSILAEWELASSLSPEQKNTLASYLLKRAHGLKTDSQEALLRELEGNGIVLKDKAGNDVTVEALDLAIASAVTTRNTQRIRVYPEYLAKKADNNKIPQPVVLFAGEGRVDTGKLKTPEEIEARRKRVEQLRDSGEGILLIGDFHLFRSDKENKAFERLLEQLKSKPPKKLLIGGDVVDSPGVLFKALPNLAARVAKGDRLPKLIETELARLAEILSKGEKLPEILNEPAVGLKPGKTPPEFTAESAARIRFALTVIELKRLKETLPDTDISYIVGNHDVPRAEFLSRTSNATRVEFKNKSGKVSLELPFTLSLEGGEMKKESLIAQLAQKNPKLSKAQLEKDANLWFPLVKQAFGIKGSSLNTLSEHRHYDLAFANWFTQRLRDFNVTTLIIDPAAPLQIGDTVISHEPQFQTRKRSEAPNLARLISPADNATGPIPRFNEFVRRAINFDQHVSASVIRSDDAGGFSNHLVGAFSASNANPGQRYSAAILDPRTGELSHVSFFDGSSYFSDPSGMGIVPYRLAPVTRVNYRYPSAIPKGRG